MADGDSRLRCTLCNKMATQKSIGAYNQTLDLKNALRAHVSHNCEPMQAMRYRGVVERTEYAVTTERGH